MVERKIVVDLSMELTKGEWWSMCTSHDGLILLVTHVDLDEEKKE